MLILRTTRGPELSASGPPVSARSARGFTSKQATSRMALLALAFTAAACGDDATPCDAGVDACVCRPEWPTCPMGCTPAPLPDGGQ
jgi:hypothetical protein